MGAVVKFKISWRAVAEPLGELLALFKPRSCLLQMGERFRKTNFQFILGVKPVRSSVESIRENNLPAAGRAKIISAEVRRENRDATNVVLNIFVLDHEHVVVPAAAPPAHLCREIEQANGIKVHLPQKPSGSIGRERPGTAVQRLGGDASDLGRSQRISICSRFGIVERLLSFACEEKQTCISCGGKHLT